ncbi:ABC transporter ATP-binding protein [Halosimplex carlsbadense 2-9-1]|uniref:ABC transporter ATP-binding protein n=1 Tax=Halosimplex carlsbadense 2-9-1 TaxID=797114 RepID=M0CP53_9EURY|nr:ABC transporter ATP-binding protein [Halosimplex carlsbadense]ELZ24996.1 ABC transporter ATP-binding protein [Halosimplex carlsbadense 2-9-1]
MIEVTDARKRYGTVDALDGVSLSVRSGASLGLVGTNGAGKTTLFRLLVGHETPDAGSVRVAGVDPTDGTRVRERVGYLPEDAGFQPALTGEEVLGYYADMRGVEAPRVETLLSVVGLPGAGDRPVGGYSNGMNRRLGLAVALLGDPDVLLLDEPTAGLDPAGVDAFNRVVERVRDERAVTVVLSTHVLSEVEALCDRVAVLDDGTLRTVGTVDEVTRSAGDEVTVTARYEDSEAVAAATEAVREALADPDVSAGERTLELAVESVAVTDALGAVVETDPESVSVDEPDLEAAVREAVAPGGERR